MIKNKTAIVIVNYQTAWHLNECLKSIFRHTTNFHIFLVQNEPDRESLQVSNRFKKFYLELLTVKVNSFNLGLVGGVNSVFKEASQYSRVCFLNSDIIVTQNWLSELNKAMDSDNSILQVSPDLNHYYKESFFWRMVKQKIIPKFPKIGNYIYKKYINFNPPRSKDESHEFQESTKFYQFCTGACNLVKTEPFLQRGYFWDPNIIHGYGDDFDTTFFLRQHGKVGVINTSYVFHFINASFNRLKKDQSYAKEMLKFWNRMYVINKWEDMLKKEIRNLSIDDFIHLSNTADVIKDFNFWTALKSNYPKVTDTITTLPAKQYAKQLGIYPEGA